MTNINNTITYYYMIGCHFCDLAKDVIEELKKSYNITEIESKDMPDGVTGVDGFPTLMIRDKKFEGAINMENKDSLIKWIRESTLTQGVKKTFVKNKDNVYKFKKRNITTKNKGKKKKITYKKGHLNGIKGIFLTKYKRTFIPDKY